VAAFVAADVLEAFLEDGFAGVVEHLLEDGGGGDLAHQEGAEQHGQVVLGHGLLVAGPVAAAIEIQPLHVLLQALAELGLGLVGQRVRVAEHLGDGQAAHDFVVLLVAGDGEEALADRVFLVDLIGLDQRFGEDRGAEASNTDSRLHQ
jgi:hypothetical protein